MDQSPLSYEYLMHKISCETNTFVSNIPPKTPIITNSNYMEKACQATVDKFNHSLNSQKTYVHHCILFSYNKAAGLNEKYLVEITEYKNHI